MATMNVEILTPEAALWTGTATALMARSSEGEFTVLPEHTATVGDVVAYVVRVQTTDEGEIAFAATPRSKAVIDRMDNLASADHQQHLADNGDERGSKEQQ